MEELYKFLGVTALVFSIILACKIFERLFLTPNSSPMPFRRNRRKIRTGVRRMCAEHITVIMVPGSMAILDPKNCYLCKRRKEENE